MKQMRAVNKTWQRGFENIVSGIAVGYETPVLLPWGGEALRFPALTSLNLRGSEMYEGALGALRLFQSLVSLDLSGWAR